MTTIKLRIFWGALAFGASAFVGAAANAGSLAEGTDDAPVIGDSYSAVDFSGFYAGGAIGQMRQTHQTRESAGYRRACASSNHEEYRWAGKCEVTQADWETSPELLALGAPVQGHPSGESANTRAITDFRYHADASGGLADGKYPGVWVSEQTGTLEYTSLTDNGATREWGNYATNEFLGEVFSLATDEDTTTAYGIYGGYRYALSDTLYIGGELSAMQGDDLLLAAEVTASAAWGRALFTAYGGYAEVDGSGGTSKGVGAGYLLNDNWMANVKYSEAGVDTLALRMEWVW